MGQVVRARANEEEEEEEEEEEDEESLRCRRYLYSIVSRITEGESERARVRTI